jgi:hypothetical protein
MGIGGALLIGFSSWFIASSIRQSKGFFRAVRVLLGELLSLLGVAAIAYPIFVGSMELFKTLFTKL